MVRLAYSEAARDHSRICRFGATCYISENSKRIHGKSKEIRGKSKEN
jgi:hypothetical protein